MLDYERVEAAAGKKKNSMKCEKRNFSGSCFAFETEKRKLKSELGFCRRSLHVILLSLTSLLLGGGNGNSAED